MKFPIKAEDVPTFKRNGFTVTKEVQYFAQRMRGGGSAPIARKSRRPRKHSQGVLLTGKRAKFAVPNSITAKVFVAAKDILERRRKNKNVKQNCLVRGQLITAVAIRGGLKLVQIGPAISVLVNKHKLLKYVEVK